MPKLTIDGVEIARHIICAMRDAATWPAGSDFRPELERRIANRQSRELLEAAE